MFVHFTIYNTKHNPPKVYKIYIVKNSIFLLLWICKLQMKMSFMVLEIWLLALESFGNFSDEFV